MAGTVQIIITAKDMAGRIIQGVTSKVEGMAARAKAALMSVQGAMAALGVTVAAGAVVKYLVDANTQFQQLQARLQTFTGSADSARAVFDQLTKFAADTPFELQDVVSAFITLRSAGIQPTEETLTRLGDQASAFGANITDMAEAVRAAATGETERLKRFGITASVQGEKIALSFQGATTVVNKNAAEITNFLETLSKQKFGDAMARQMDTIGGQTSNLSDNLFQLATQAGDAGLAGAFKGSLKELNAFLTRLRESPATFNYVVGVIMQTVGTSWTTATRIVAAAWNIGQAIGALATQTISGIQLVVVKGLDLLYKGVTKGIETLNKLPGVEIDWRPPDMSGWVAGAVEDWQEGNDRLAVIRDNLQTNFEDIGSSWGKMGAAISTTADSTKTAVEGVKTAGAGLAADGLATGQAFSAANVPLEQRIKLLAEAVKHISTVIEADDMLAKIETDLVGALAKGNLPFEKRVELEERLADVRKARQDADFASGIAPVTEQTTREGLQIRRTPIAIAPPTETPKEPPVLNGAQEVFANITAGANDATEAIQGTATAMDYFAGSALANLAGTWVEAWQAFGSGAVNAGQAVINAGKGAIAASAGNKAKETALDAARAAAEGLTNPIKLIEAAKLFAVSAGYGALAGALGGRGGGGRGGLGGGGGLALAKRDNDKLQSQDESIGTIVVEGGLLDMNDPRQAEALENALNRLGRQRRVKIVKG